MIATVTVTVTARSLLMRFEILVYFAAFASSLCSFVVHGFWRNTKHKTHS
jgi:hypothetical protein